jgi:Protein of unknown function, DUF481
MGLVLGYRKICCCVLLVALCGAASARADIVWMHNGDRITGTIKSLDHDDLLLALPGSAQLVIAWRDVKTLRSERVLLIAPQGGGEVITSKLRETADGHVQLSDSRVLALADIRSLAAPIRRSRNYKWNGKLDLELESKRESEEHKDKLKTKLDSRLQHSNWRHHFESESEYEKRDAETSNDKYQLGYALDHLFEPEWLWRVHSRYERNALDKLWMTREIGSGPGVRLQGDTLGRLELVLEWILMDFRSHTPSSDPPTRWNAELNVKAAGLSWDWNRNLFASALELFSNGTLYLPHSVSADTEIHMSDETQTERLEFEIDSIIDGELGLRYRLNRNINVAARIEYDRITGSGLHQTERRTFISIGYEW